jgi:4-amino-4-deoxy-L-arabinose transferase-like glycosyltransferase
MNSLLAKYHHAQFPFWVFTWAVFVIAILPSLIQDGMFIDGTQYAVVSKNFANGLGTFWFPHITQNWEVMGSNVFLENPPLVYAIQGMFFKVFGDGMYTERIYCLFTALLAAFLMVRIWKLVTRGKKQLQELAWLPVLIWVSMPLVFRSYQMNLQENTMGVFVLASVYAVLAGLEKQRYSYLYMILGGALVFLATLCKGVTGLFPLVTVAMYWISGGKIKFQKVILFSLVLLLVPVVLYMVVLLNDNAYESLSFYFRARLVERINNDPVQDSHFHIVFELFLELLPAILVSFILFLTRRSKINTGEHLKERRFILFFLLLGLSGSLPLALTLVQRAFYLVPSLPFFAMAFALFIIPYALDLLQKLSEHTPGFKLFRMFAISLLMGGIVYTGFQAGKSERDHDILHDTYLMGEIIEDGSRVHLEAAYSPSDSLRHWNLELYLARYFNISLGASLEDTRYLIYFEDGIPPDQTLFEPVPLDTRTYSLYRKQD